MHAAFTVVADAAVHARRFDGINSRAITVSWRSTVALDRVWFRYGSIFRRFVLETTAT